MFPCFKHITKSFKTSSMRYIRIKFYNISCRQNGIFRYIAKKSPESLMYDQPLCKTGLRWWSRNFYNFSVGFPQLEITGLPGTFLRCLWILGYRYNFPKLVAFLYSKEKYFSSFSEITPFLLRFLNMVLLFSTRSVRIFSLNLTSWYSFLSLNCFFRLHQII